MSWATNWKPSERASAAEAPGFVVRGVDILRFTTVEKVNDGAAVGPRTTVQNPEVNTIDLRRIDELGQRHDTLITAVDEPQAEPLGSSSERFTVETSDVIDQRIERRHQVRIAAQNCRFTQMIGDRHGGTEPVRFADHQGLWSIEFLDRDADRLGDRLPMPASQIIECRLDEHGGESYMTGKTERPSSRSERAKA